MSISFNDNGFHVSCSVDRCGVSFSGGVAYFDDLNGNAHKLSTDCITAVSGVDSAQLSDSIGTYLYNPVGLFTVTFNRDGLRFGGSSEPVADDLLFLF